jgi:hypothetical protein
MPIKLYVPDAPTDLVWENSEKTSTQNTLQWTAPANNGGSVITNYNVIRESVVLTRVESTTTSQLVTDLVLGTTYNFEVQAVNAEGSSVSTEKLSYTHALVPAAPEAP